MGHYDEQREEWMDEMRATRAAVKEHEELFNSGAWIGWNQEVEGRPAVIHPRSEVEYAWKNHHGAGISTVEAVAVPWHHVVAFRVVQAHVQPREWDIMVPPNGEVVRVREVLQ